MNIFDDAERLAGCDASDKSMEQLTLRTKIGGTLDRANEFVDRGMPGKLGRPGPARSRCLFQGREVRRNKNLIVLAHDHRLRLGAKRLKLRILALGLAGAFAMIRVLVGPDVDDLVQGSYICGPPSY